MFIDNCRLLQFPRIGDERGNLTFIEAERHVPFEVKRVFYLYGVPLGQSRGAHAHRELHQVMICLAGSFDVIVRDGIKEQRYSLTDPSFGLYVPPMVWDLEVNFSAGAVCMVLASDYYDEADYYRDWNEYLEAVGKGRQGVDVTVTNSVPIF